MRVLSTRAVLVSCGLLAFAPIAGCSGDGGDQTTPQLDAGSDAVQAVDTQPPDTMTGDSAVPDSATEDTAADDTAAPDTGGSDGALLDTAVDTAVPDTATPTVPARRLLQIITSTGAAKVYSVDGDGVIRLSATIATSFGSLVGYLYSIVPTGTGRDAYFVMCHPTTGNAKVFKIAGDLAATTTALTPTTITSCPSQPLGVRPGMMLLYNSGAGTMASYSVNADGTFTLRDARGGLTAKSGVGYSSETNRNGEAILAAADDGSGVVLDVSTTGGIAFRKTLAAGTFPSAQVVTAHFGGSSYALYGYTSHSVLTLTVTSTGDITKGGSTGDIGTYRAMEGFADGVAAFYNDQPTATRSRVARLTTASPYFTALGGERTDLASDAQPAVFALP